MHVPILPLLLCLPSFSLHCAGDPVSPWVLYANSTHVKGQSGLFPNWPTCCCHFDLSIITRAILIFSHPARGSCLITPDVPHRSCLWTSIILTGCPYIKLFFKLSTVRGSLHTGESIGVRARSLTFTMGSLSECLMSLDLSFFLWKTYNITSFIRFSQRLNKTL